MAIQITEVFYPQTRSAWRDWLAEHHPDTREVWVRRFKKGARSLSITYDDLVEEALCFGWIDGVIKKFDDESNVVRVTPRRPKGTFLSELNRQRVWKLQRLGLMTPAGVSPIADQIGSPDDDFEVPSWIENRLRSDDDVWLRFQSFPLMYRRLKVAWIDEVRGESRRSEAEKRLAYLIKMTKVGKVYGTVPDVFGNDQRTGAT